MDTLELQICDIARTCNIDPDLALAIAFVETGVNSDLVRYEPNWKYPYVPEKYAQRLGITADTEKILQSMSWGPLQIMGASARILGFSGMITLLVKPQFGVLYACKYLQTLQRKFGNDPDMISAYNQGIPAKDNGVYRNYKYVTQVLDRMAFLKRSNE